MASVDIVIPVYNEEHVLAQSVETLRQFLAQHPQHDWRIVVADNASTDGTLRLAEKLSDQHAEVSCVHLPQKGRGRALRHAWMASDAEIVSFMDVDLSTDISALPALIGAIADEGYDIAIGTRLASGSRTTRSFRREMISRVYNLLIKVMFFTRFSDAQCGFKAMSRQAAHELLPHAQNEQWFLDTELLILAEKGGYRIKEIPVRWVEDPDSRVRVASTAWEDIRGLLRLRFSRLPRRPGV
jgi:glycosyltransferase involved in cell wall biosynthesis